MPQSVIRVISGIIGKAAEYDMVRAADQRAALVPVKKRTGCDRK